MNTTPSSSLARVLGAPTATAIVVGTIIGSGVFKKPAAIAEVLPHSGLVALIWIIGGLLVFLGALAYAEIAVILPRAGGNYVFLREGYGRLAGFLWGWVEFWIIRSASLAALATIFTESLNDILSSLFSNYRLGLFTQRGMTATVILGLAAVNIRGVRWGGGLQVFLTVIKVVSLLSIGLLPFILLGLNSSPTGELPSPKNLDPIWPDDWSKITAGALATALLSVLWPYHGWMNIAPVAGEVRDPQRNLPLSLLLGVIIVITLYLGCNLAYYLTLPGSEIKTLTNTPVATVFAVRLLGSIGGVLASAIVMCSVFGSLNGNILVGPRLLYAMGQDGLAPRWLQYVHPRWGTPAPAIAALSLWATFLVLGEGILAATGALTNIKSPFDRLTDFAMFGAIIFETMAVMAIFRLRKLMPDAPRPYRCPGYPVVPLLYAIVPAFILGNMFWKDSWQALVKESLEALIGVTFILSGAAVYYLLGLQRKPAGASEPAPQ